MAGLFESVTRVAIEEIIRNHAQTSKFGYVLTESAFQDMTDDLFNLLLASRELKAAGDRLTGGVASAPARAPGKNANR